MKILELGLRLILVFGAAFSFWACSVKKTEITEYTFALIAISDGQEPQLLGGGNGSKDGNAATVQEKVIVELFETTVKSACSSGSTYKVYFKTPKESVTPITVPEVESRLPLVKTGNC